MEEMFLIWEKKHRRRRRRCSKARLLMTQRNSFSNLVSFYLRGPRCRLYFHWRFSVSSIRPDRPGLVETTLTDFQKVRWKGDTRAATEETADLYFDGNRVTLLYGVG